MFSTTYFLPALVFFSIALISSTSAAVYNTRRFVLPVDEEMQREMINDLLQREYADRYREYIERGLGTALKNNVEDTETHGGIHPLKRGQTFVRFGKRSQISN
ncbi:hypothetical protein ACH3XW_20735 [Acanthocheilonema viteae]